MPHEYEINESGDPVKKWIAALDENSRSHQYKTTTKLEALLKAAFEETQAATHVLTGSLKASGKTESDFHDDVWSGTIEYGGELWRTPAPGPPNDPVDYAIYEMARGGDHDFLAGLVGFEDRVQEILDEGFPG